MARLKGSGQFHNKFQICISNEQLEALQQKAKARQVGVSEVIRSCIDRALDPEKLLQATIATRTTNWDRLINEVLPQLDEMERQEFDEILYGPGGEVEAEEWMKKNAEILRQTS